MTVISFVHSALFMCAPGFPPYEAVFFEVLSRFAVNSRFVNIGAFDGIWDDPIYNLMLKKDFKGLAIEGSKRAEYNLRKNLRPFTDKVDATTGLPENKTHVLIVYATSANILNIFYRYSVPSDVDLVKIDIDSWDCAVLKALLARKSIRPRFLAVEVNNDIPTPFYFSARERYAGINMFRGCYGCSFASLASILDPEYKLIAAGGEHETLWIRRDIFLNLFPAFVELAYELSSPHFLTRVGLALKPQNAETSDAAQQVELEAGSRHQVWQTPLQLSRPQFSGDEAVGSYSLVEKCLSTSSHTHLRHYYAGDGERPSGFPYYLSTDWEKAYTNKTHADGILRRVLVPLMSWGCALCNSISTCTSPSLKYDHAFTMYHLVER